MENNLIWVMYWVLTWPWNEAAIGNVSEEAYCVVTVLVERNLQSSPLLKLFGVNMFLWKGRLVLIASNLVETTCLCKTEKWFKCEFLFCCTPTLLVPLVLFHLGLDLYRWYWFQIYFMKNSVKETIFKIILGFCCCNFTS